MMPVLAGAATGGGHVPVLLREVLATLAPQKGEVFVDGTFGAGGYTRALLEAADCRVLAIDRDPHALASASILVTEFRERLMLRQGRFSAVDEIAKSAGISEADGVVLDVGVSSMQLADAGRGFSFQVDGPLDMRMSDEGPTAADIVNGWGIAELAELIRTYGEEPRAGAIARSIVRARVHAPILTTFGLVAAIGQAAGSYRQNLKIHPATRTFQALRVHVNSELEELRGGLAAAERLLRVGGRLAVVTFHSLEDRIAKQFLAERSGHIPAVSRHLPEKNVKPTPSFELLFKGHIQASRQELIANPRARSAKLRAARRTAAPAQSATASRKWS